MTGERGLGWGLFVTVVRIRMAIVNKVISITIDNWVSGYDVRYGREFDLNEWVLIINKIEPKNMISVCVVRTLSQ